MWSSQAFVEPKVNRQPGFRRGERGARRAVPQKRQSTRQANHTRKLTDKPSNQPSSKQTGKQRKRKNKTKQNNATRHKTTQRYLATRNPTIAKQSKKTNRTTYWQAGRQPHMTGRVHTMCSLAQNKHRNNFNLALRCPYICTSKHWLPFNFEV